MNSEALEVARLRAKMWAQECRDLEEELSMAEEECRNAYDEIDRLEKLNEHV